MTVACTKITFKYFLCQKNFPLQKQLLSHERTKHRNNKSEAGEQRLKQILNYEHWNCCQDLKTNTTGYVLFVNYEGIYGVTFSWAQNELVENDRIFQCGTVTCTFTTNSREFVDEDYILDFDDFNRNCFFLDFLGDFNKNYFSLLYNK
ncbi:hypothetical protein GLOIN_2v1474312 [Rhizophagus irregularis DAOM 181602=DAOM 197198]|uniref:C2H2-type domain-containing protein n=1 Tax=Rhizophagus irregularis (strain DAOM 181602 / DAOM 197198 / MUCL 43194) TaxID=747089 RepID=A0A2P4QGS3_RHIID|nr:hypothetical protein GLOIN_2v1474312 [Rhizophagus irregularis DAOM 181602=DAOM 197198]POG76835.1 hypothetical protein GLOIN_2v1474312 [Rhizophagus irregularis DAOM 181602=DAOM 197198]|eukprot:XP_025183701.1 hypothetical protein GLOIN_2v1474312 [Rhizophagus irregularis DAOM 181602=DAOM 197198]